MSETVWIVIIAAILIAVLLALFLGRRLKISRDRVEVGGGASQDLAATDNAQVKSVAQRGNDGQQRVRASGNARIGSVEQDTRTSAAKDES
jgi:hypothetical protein